MISLNDLSISINELEEKIGYKFKNKDNLKNALYHSSYVNENKVLNLLSNERLEFLGDSILNLVVSEYIFINFTRYSEGEMTRTRANIVCEASLLECSNKISIGKYLVFGKGEELTGGRSRPSILADAFEALIGAIYVDGGMEGAKKFILDNLGHILDEYNNQGLIRLDFKTELQEMVQRSSEGKISYDIIDQKGPDHDKIFISRVRVGDKSLGTGEGKSKKEAEQNAAKEALRILKENN